MLAAKGFEKLGPPPKRSQHERSWVTRAGKPIEPPGGRPASGSALRGAQLTPPGTRSPPSVWLCSGEAMLSPSKHRYGEGPFWKTKPKKTALSSHVPKPKMISHHGGKYAPNTGVPDGERGDAGLTTHSPTTLDIILASQKTA